MTSSPALDGPFYPPTLGVPERFTPQQLRASLDITMGEHGAGPVWLFAYGSLIWRPEFPVAEARRARVHGYHRGLYLWSLTHRGTPEAPGLVLGLDRGGSCSGFAFRLPEDNLDANLYALWEREMPYASYRPEWLSCRLDDGSRVRALGFVLERHLPTYAGSLPDSIFQHVLDSAQGHFGTTRDYVEQTAKALRDYAMPDLNLEGILARCCPLRRAQE